MLLNDEGKKELLNTKFHRYFDLELNEININEDNINQFVNLTIKLDTILNFCSENDISTNIFNDNFNNIIFTPSNSQDIYSYELYKNIFYIRMNPFSKEIRMHITPKIYDASNTSNNPVLFFRDSQIFKTESHPNETFIKATDFYDRDSTQDDKVNLNWLKSTVDKNNSNVTDKAGAYLFNIKDKTVGMQNIQINTGYYYNNSNPTDEFNHYIGIIDETNFGKDDELIEESVTLVNRVSTPDSSTFKDDIIKLSIDAYKNMKNAEYSLSNNPGDERDSDDVDIEKNKEYEKVLKYFGDSLYVFTDENYGSKQILSGQWKEEEEEDEEEVEEGDLADSTR